MADVQFYKPTDKSIERKRRMAQTLIQQGQQTPNEMVSGIVVKKSPLDGLAKALTQGFGGYIEGQANQEGAGREEAKRQAISDALMVGAGNDGFNEALTANADTAPIALQAALAQQKARSGGASFGGSTGVLLDRLVAEDNGLDSLQDALSALKGGAGATGRLNAEVNLGRQANYEKQSGTNTSDLEYKPQIAAENLIAVEEAKALRLLPKIEQDVRYMNSILEKVKTHPGLSSGTGKSSLMPAIPGTERKSFDVLLDQVQGKQFMEAYQSLKGGGVITEIEGEKATQALARMDQAQSEEDFIEAVNDFQGVVNRGFALQKQMAGSPQQTQGAIGLQQPSDVGMTPEEQLELEQLRAKYGR